MRELIVKAVVLLLVCWSTGSYGQKGPGGVSEETPDPITGGECRAVESTCGLWLDASTITTLLDGADLLTWEDVSISSDCDDAFANNASTPPIYRNNPAYTINGFPTITFEDGRFLRINSSNDLNTEQVSYTRSIFFAFRTSEDIQSKQIIYEEGGTVRGYNVTIHQGFILIGSYDWQGDGDGTPRWGYTYTYHPIEENTTYILTSKMYAANTGTVAANANYYVKGWLNGIPFSNNTSSSGGGAEYQFPHEISQGFSDQLVSGMFLGPSNGNFTNNGIGTLWNHPDPCGLGAINSDMVDKDGVKNNKTGQNPFKGLLAEMIVYRGEVVADEVTDVQRIIVENYLAAKYIAELQAGDKYPYEYLYGRDLIGLGRNVNSGPTHSTSQGRNPFKLTKSIIPNSSNIYFFTGHNGEPLSWTDEGVPYGSTNIERLERSWRVSKTGANIGALTLSVDLSDAVELTPPTGYAGEKLVLLLDETSNNFPNFSLPTTKVLEIPELPMGSNNFQLDYDFQDGSFYTLAWLRPEVNFTSSESFSVESDLPLYNTVNIEIQLNYDPFPLGSPVDVNFSLIGNTATLATTWPPTVPGDDFYYNSDASAMTSQTVQIPLGAQSTNIQLRIINDDAQETPLTEDFDIVLNTASGGVLVGPVSTHLHTIYDDDPPPKIFFPAAQPAPTWQENIGTGVMRVSLTSPIDATFYLRIDENGGNPLPPNARPSTSGPDPADYSHNESQIFSITGGSTFIDIPITIFDDYVDEENEVVKARIQPISGAGALSASDVRFTFTIADNDVPAPTFTVASQIGYESNGSPSLLVSLGEVTDPTRVISSRDVTVDYTMLSGAVSPATYIADYSGLQSNQVIFPPFSADAYIGPFTVVNDEMDESPENIDFTLTGGNSGGDPVSLGPIPSMTYTIYDYLPFEFQGVGGVGKNHDNVVWIDASQEPLGSNIAEVDNKAPNFPNPNQSIRIRREGANSGADNIASGIGSRNALDFNGLPNPAGTANPSNATTYQIDDDARINTAGTVDKLSFFFVVRPESIPTVGTQTNGAPDNSRGRLIYEQGGNSRGVSVYLYNRRFYFHAWNNVDDDGNGPGDDAPWGRSSNNRSGSVYAFSHIIPTTPEDYVISCHYDNANIDNPLRIYVNGRMGTFNVASPTDATVGRLWGHSGDIGLGGVVNGCLFHFANNGGADKKCAFDGKIAEYLSFHGLEENNGSSSMNESRRIIIENSLAAKYGITLDDNDGGNTTPMIFDLNSPNALDYFDDAAGIGQVGTDDLHNTAQGPNSVLQVRNPNYSPSTDPGFIVWSHNGEDLTNTWPYTENPLNLPPGINEKSGQVWKVYSSGAAESAEFLISFSASNNATALQSLNSLKLMTHTNDANPNDFSGATVYSGNMLSGYQARFTNIPVTNGMYVALGNTSDYFNSPLPIELLNFDARLNEPLVNLDWSTATETNNDYFIVERAGDDLVWKPLMQVQGAGNSSSTISYHEVDREPLNGVSYYRLKQVDFDGHFEYSDVVSVVRTHKQAENDLYLFPNPSSIGSVYVTLPEHKSDELVGDLSMFEISGKKVWEERAPFNGGQFELNYGDLPSGIYLIQLQTQDLNLTKKLVIR